MKSILFGLVGILLVIFSEAGYSSAKPLQTRIAGMKLIVHPMPGKEMVVIRGSLPAGLDKAPPGHSYLPELAGAMLDRGTTRHDRAWMADRWAEMGATILLAVNTNEVRFSLRCLAKDVAPALTLLAEQLRFPAFAADELVLVKRLQVQAIESQLQHTETRAAHEFNRAAYPPGHPYRPATMDEYLASVENAAVEDLKQFHAAHYGPSHLSLVVAGAVDSSQVKNVARRVFGGWTGGSAPVVAPKVSSGAAFQELGIFVPNRANVSVVIGQAIGLHPDNPDYLALLLGVSVLGGDTLYSRLTKSTRDQEGLTYAIHANLGRDLAGQFVDGDFRIVSGFAPSLLAEGIASARRHLAQWHRDGVTAAELEEHQSGIAGRFRVDLASVETVSRVLLEAAIRGEDVADLEAYSRKLQAVSLQQVNAAIRRYLDPEKMVLVKAGTIEPANPLRRGR